MAEKYFSLSQLKGISRIETNQWSGPSEVCDLYDLKKLPPADVRPVVRSHWKKNDNGTYSCERCHSWIPEEQRHYANWCLYCGADMRGGDAES